MSTLGYGLAGAAFAAIVFLQTGVTAQFERKSSFLRERAARFYGERRGGGASELCVCRALVRLPPRGVTLRARDVLNRCAVRRRRGPRVRLHLLLALQTAAFSGGLLLLVPVRVRSRCLFRSR